MATKGSRQVPYTWSEYTTKVSSNTWQGGWVESRGENNYRTHALDVYTGSCAKSYPVPYNIFCEMIQNGIWLGGWYRTEQYLLKYRAFDGTEYESTLCEESNPCSLSLYGEMISNEIWEGGWVQEYNGTLRYVQSLQIVISSGSGSGNGYGSGISGGSVPEAGSGSGELEALGCSISAGNHVVAPVHDENGKQIGTLHANWTSGNTIGQHELSVVTISISPQLNSNTFNTNNLYTVWINAYELRINGTYIFTQNGESTLGHVYNEFIIPEEFRQYD